MYHNELLLVQFMIVYFGGTVDGYLSNLDPMYSEY